MPDLAGGRFTGRPAVLHVSSHLRRRLDHGWSLARLDPGEAPTPDALAARRPEWRTAQVPGTVAAADRAAARLLRPEDAEDYDAHDWWYHCEFGDDGDVADEAVLSFGGLATLAEVWLNGERLGCSRNMFRALELDVGGRLARRNELHLRFAALGPELARRRPRPRWKVRLVEDQALRWHRTTLLGRMPGWGPRLHTVGPWRPVQLEQRRVLALDDGDVLPTVGSAGPALVADLHLRPLGGARIGSATLECAGTRHPLAVHALADGRVRVTGTVPVPDAARWWPHTHGAPALHALALDLDTSEGPVRVELGDVGFRAIAVDRADGAFELRVNDVPVFCRGACWLPPDAVSLRAPDD
ncbi:MAG TPA: hypothetical protein VFX50_04810, partial [Gemmatimonadales bacterium]|nr:hypothetical protein [Gemmatimonadales bacterium]